MIIKFLLCRKIFDVVYYEIEIWLMLHSAVKFRQNTLNCRKLNCKIESTIMLRESSQGENSVMRVRLEGHKKPIRGHKKPIRNIH